MSSHEPRPKVSDLIKNAKARRERHMMGPAMAAPIAPAIGPSAPEPVARPASMSNGSFRMENVRSESIPD